MKTKLSGIYTIKNIINNKIYIGSSVDLEARKRTHYSRLKLETHHSIVLQRAYNKYGKANIIFQIIELCVKEELISREQYYIDKLNPEYNICKVAGSILGSKGTVESNKKKSMNHFQRNKFGKDNLSSKTIYRYDINGKYVDKYYGGGDISRRLGLDPANIRRAIKNRWYCHNYFWAYQYFGIYWKNKPTIWDRSKTRKPIIMMDKNKRIIKEFDSIKSGDLFFNNKSSCISKALRSGGKYHGYFFKYKEKN